MLVNLAEILEPAVEGGYGVASFNVFGWEDAVAVLRAAEETGAPVILAASLDFTRVMPVKLIAPMLRHLAETASVPVCTHLDHCYEVDAVRAAVDAGFSSVMFDGSQLPLDENIAGTRLVRDHAHAAGCSVEAEVGSVPYATGRDHIRSEATRPEDAARLATEAQPDALAVSVGNIHRLKAPGAIIDFERLAEIERVVPVPLVIHGTSGIHDADLAALARMRVAKFNIGTVLRQAFGAGLRDALASDPDLFDRTEIMRQAMPPVTAAATRMIRLLGWRSLAE